MKMMKELVFKTKDGVELYAHCLGDSVYKFSSSNPEAVKKALKDDLNGSPMDRKLALGYLTAMKSFGCVKQ